MNMDIRSLICDTFCANNIEFNERMDTVEASFQITAKILKQAMNSINSVFEKIPARDEISFSFCDDNDECLFKIRSHEVQRQNTSTFLDDLDDDDETCINVEINKTIKNGLFSIYNFSSFTSYLIAQPITDILKWFAQKLHKQQSLIFEIFDTEVSFSTRTMAFASSEFTEFKPLIDREQRIIDCKDTAYFYNMDKYELIPDDFIIEGVIKSGECIKPVFDKLATILSLTYISTSASLINDKINFQINGERIVSYEIDTKTIEANPQWMKIYSWIYTDGNPTDKALIARNVISITCKFDQILSQNDSIFEAIKSNYSLYLRNNVDQYLNLKRDISNFIYEIVTKVNDYSLEILEKFKANLLTIFVFIFTVILTRIGSASSWQNIFTRDTLFLLEFVLLGSLFYLGICWLEVKHKLKKTMRGYDNIKENYRNVLSDIEIENAFNNDKFINDTIISVKNNMLLWAVIWGIILILIIFVIEAFTTSHGIITWLVSKFFNFAENKQVLTYSIIKF